MTTKRLLRNVRARGLLSALVLFSLTLPSPAAAPARPITLETLLTEMVDRSAPAHLPVPAYTCRQSSSHDPRKQDPKDHDGWHANNDHDQAIRTQTNEGRQEWVILDDQGPGVITRFWLPLSGDKEKQVIRFYFDGATTPAITANFNGLLSGHGFVKPPFAFVAWDEPDLVNQLKPGTKTPRGMAGDLYLPIPFAKSCKITLDQVPFYYVINYRAYEPGTPVKTFSMDSYTKAAPALEKASAALLAKPAIPHAGKTKRATLAPGQGIALELPKGAAAVTFVSVQVDPKDAPQVLRSLVLGAQFDGESAVWCPLGEFFGTGARLHPVRDWWRTVQEDGLMSVRWVMPYQKTGALSLHNYGTRPVTVTLAAATGPWKWDDRSLHFYGRWHAGFDLPTRPMSDWNYLEARGQGLYVGDTLTVFNPVTPWYGEGDERIFLDGAPKAAHIGTGTEDYYGYAWGMADFFNSPFISMPLREVPNRNDWRGYTTTSRVRLLDGIPWRQQIQHDMEIWHWSDTRVDYAVGTFFYGRPILQHNRQPQPEAAARPLRELPSDPSQFKIVGAVECETLPVAATSDQLRVSTQENALREGRWSGNKQLFLQANKVGDFIELTIPASGNTPRKVTVYATRSYDYGIVRFTVNGEPAKQFDLYGKDPVASGPLELGTFTPADGKLRLRATVTDANSASRGERYYFGLDCVVLDPK